MGLVNLSDRMQPVIDETASLPVDGRAHPAAAVVPDDHDVLHLDHIDGELQHRQVVGVLRRCEVGDVAMDEQLTGVEIDDLVGRHATVGTPDPQVFRRLLTFETAEKIRISRNLALRPRAVLRLQVIQHARPLSLKLRRRKASTWRTAEC